MLGPDGPDAPTPAAGAAPEEEKPAEETAAECGNGGTAHCRDAAEEAAAA